MAKLDLVIDDALEQDFRTAIAQHRGMKKGNLSKAAEEAIRMWLQVNPVKVEHPA